jgi:hypothetical protein
MDVCTPMLHAAPCPTNFHFPLSLGQSLYRQDWLQTTHFPSAEEHRGWNEFWPLMALHSLACRPPKDFKIKQCCFQGTRSSSISLNIFFSGGPPKPGMPCMPYLICSAQITCSRKGPNLLPTSDQLCILPS